jgi:hypothetical protein
MTFLSRVYVCCPCECVCVVSVCAWESMCVCSRTCIRYFSCESKSILSVVSQSSVDRKETIQPFRKSLRLIYIFVYGRSKYLAFERIPSLTWRNCFRENFCHDIGCFCTETFVALNGDYNWLKRNTLTAIFANGYPPWQPTAVTVISYAPAVLPHSW